jgi:uncharacterized protein DUF4272
MSLEEIKLKTMNHLSSISIEVPDHLPLIEDLNEVNPQTTQSIASRLLAILYVMGLGYEADRKYILDLLNTYNLMPHISSYENSLLRKAVLSEQDQVNMTWLDESAHALAWCLGLLELDPSVPCDLDYLMEITPFNKSPEDFLAKVKIRPIRDIQEQSDLLYRLHWYAKNNADSKISKSIIYERRKAIDWAYGVEEDWDNIPMDT